MRRLDRRWLWALSLALHAAFLLVAVQLKPPPPPPLAREPLWLDLLETPAPATEPLAAPAPEAPPPAPRAAQPNVHPKAAPKVEPPAPAPLQVATAAPLAPPPAQPLSLLPDPQRLELRLPEAEPSHGHLIHNDPSELPDPQAVAAYQAEQARARVDGFARDELSVVRVESGAVDGYFNALHHRLQQGASHPPLFGDADKLAQLPKTWVNSWAPAAQRYGAGQLPYSTQGQPNPVPSAVQEAADRGSPQAREFAQLLTVGAGLRDLGDGKMGSNMEAVVELRQAATGALLEALLLRSSGSQPFDAWVLDVAVKAVPLTLAPPDAGLGIHPDGMRSVWAFSGKVVYRRSVRDVNIKDDWWYFALAAPLSAITGHFDEVTGEADYVDLRHPSFECKTRLLQVY